MNSILTTSMIAQNKIGKTKKKVKSQSLPKFKTTVTIKVKKVKKKK